NWAATGGNIVRSAQNRSADVVNILDFGADPTGVSDSAPAIINAAATVSADNARQKAVYVPAGIYRVNSQIHLSAAQTLFGDSRGSSVLMIDQSFASSA